MVIYFGADHRGFSLKENLKASLKDQGYEVVDCGAAAYDEADDFPDFAAAVARNISSDPERGRGILVCGSGGGVTVAANKFRHVRACVGFATDQVFDMRHDEDLNVLCLASDYVNEIEAQKLVRVFLETPFDKEERFLRRLGKIGQIEDSA